jgi:phosphoenolpyruvate carboxykinase (ATP)
MMANQSHRPAKGRTELEEELHETAHIDYERVAIVRIAPNSLHASVPCLFQKAISNRLPI